MNRLRKIGKWLFDAPRPAPELEPSIWFGMSIEPTRFTEQLARLEISLDGFNNGPTHEVAEPVPIHAKK